MKLNITSHIIDFISIYLLVVVSILAHVSRADVSDERAVVLGGSATQGASEITSSEESGVGSELESTVTTRGRILDRFNLSFLTIFYGPSIGNPSRSQPGPSGDPDPNRPVNMRNFLNLSYSLNDEFSLTGTAFWVYQPFLDQKFYLQDPFIRLSDSSLWRDGPFNLYADVRLHFGISNTSRQSDQYFGVQTVEVLSYDIPGSAWSLGSYGAARSNFFGKHGYGYDLELYLGPNVNYQISPTVLATLLFEMRGNHVFGDRFGRLMSDGTDLQPGITWNVTPRVMLNPYLNLQTSEKVSLNTTTFGLLANWNLY